MFEVIEKFFAVVTESKDMFQRDSEWKCAFFVWLSNDMTLTGYKTIIPIISSNLSVCSIIFEQQLIQTSAFLKIVWEFQQPKHRCCLARVKETLNFFPWKLIFDVAEKVHHGFVCECDHVCIRVCSIVSIFHQNNQFGSTSGSKRCYNKKICLGWD